MGAIGIELDFWKLVTKYGFCFLYYWNFSCISEHLIFDQLSPHCFYLMFLAQHNCCRCCIQVQQTSIAHDRQSRVSMEANLPRPKYLHSISNSIFTFNFFYLVYEMSLFEMVAREHLKAWFLFLYFHFAIKWGGYFKNQMPLKGLHAVWIYGKQLALQNL